MDKLTMSKRIAARTRTLMATACTKDFMENSATFRRVRSGARNKMDCCFWCKRKFEDGEMMSLAFREKQKNVVLCRKCADELTATKEQ